MEDLAHILGEALEGQISFSDQESKMKKTSNNKLPRRSLRKRRGRKRRMDPNPIWDKSVVLSDQSDTSLDEALKDYMKNITDVKGQSDSTGEEHVVKKLSSLNVTSSSNLYGESDSVPENGQNSKRALKKKKVRPKRMAVDGACGSVTRSCSVSDFNPQAENKKQKVKKSCRMKTEESKIFSQLPNLMGAQEHIVHSKRHSGKSESPINNLRSGHRDRDEMDTDHIDVSTSLQGVVPLLRCKTKSSRSSSSDGTMCSSKADDRSETMMSDEDTSGTIRGRDFSEVSDSSEDDGLFTNDEGREADDEQSDFFHEPGGSVAGIPRVIPWWEKSPQTTDEDEENFYKILNGALPLLKNNSRNGFNTRLRGMQSRVDDCSGFRNLRSRFKPKRHRKNSSSSQLSEKVVRFLRKPNEKDSEVQAMRPKQPSPLGRLSNMYSLDIRTNTKAFLRNPAMCGPAANNEFYMASSSTETDCLPKSSRPQSADPKRRRRSPRKSDSKPGMTVNGATGPIPESNVGNQMLQNMGWKPGMGLGAQGRGMREPVQVFIRPKNRGLGHWKPS